MEKFGSGLLVNGAASPYKNCSSGRGVGIMGQFLIELNSGRQRSVNNRDKCIKYRVECLFQDDTCQVDNRNSDGVDKG